MILAGDIGGTKTVLAIYDESVEPFQLIRETVFKSRDFLQFDQILHQFLGDSNPVKIRAICLGVAGPIRHGQCKTTNLPWLLSENNLAKDFGVEKVRLLNDLEAAAYGMLFLQEDEMVSLNVETDLCVRPKGNIAVIAAGTGLGEAMLYWDGKAYIPMASEGGHADFAPQSDQEVALLRYLRAELGHVSYERILSGPGIYNIYRFLRDTGFADEPEWLRKKLSQGDKSAVIGEMGLAKKDPLCVEALSLFASIYGAEAGNLALKFFAVGGVFVGGGMAPKLLSALTNGAFMRGFTGKGRYANLMRTIPVHVALNSRAPLIGSAQYALSCFDISVS
ncbi:MAG: glucokinase [Nitrospirae bacterium]|nr:glucokinase [Candidatus Troglogloeales bacterium]